MHSFEEISTLFKERFEVKQFPEYPASLYGPGEYFLTLAGKRLRPAMCLMGNELFDAINPDAYHVASAVELFHNFTLIHDDIMDKAPLRRGKPTVHAQYGEPTALLAGDVMLVLAYDYLNKIKTDYLHRIIQLFNRTARQVCEGQQLDMDFEQLDKVKMDDYIKMIELKTSVLLAASLHLGSILGGAGKGNQQHLFEFGRNLGIAFQVQDDYLDAFGDPEKFGKQVGGDILSNKKTFLLIKALEVATAEQQAALTALLAGQAVDKVQRVLQIYKDCGVDEWAKAFKKQYINNALNHLEEIAVISTRKIPLNQLATYFGDREF